MPDNVPLVTAALANAKQVEERNLSEAQKAEFARRQKEDRMYAQMVCDATDKINKIIPAGISIKDSDWRREPRYSTPTIYFQIPNYGRVYYYIPIAGDPASFYYFQDRMGYGGTKFKTWDELSVMIADHARYKGYSVGTSI